MACVQISQNINNSQRCSASEHIINERKKDLFNPFFVLNSDINILKLTKKKGEGEFQGKLHHFLIQKCTKH